MLKPYKIINDHWIELTEGPYEGIVYKYGRVELIEEDDLLRIKFEYELPDGKKLDDNFIQYIGPILSELIEDGVVKNNIVYTGGVDENRA
jgi:hypothetical protein